MIARYTMPEMATLWTDQARFEHMLRVEIAALGAVERHGLVPGGTAAAVAAKARVDVERIAELEKITEHDVIAFVSQVAETTGPEGRFLHFGLTSSDVVDTALALQAQDAAELIDTALADLVDAISAKAREHATTVMMGRTHSVHAEPMTLGLKLASWAFELSRGRRRIAAAAEEISVGKLSGAVGTYSQLGPEIEAEVMAELGLGIESAATQVVARDRHAAFLAAIAVCGGSIERAATEVRNLQHTEIGELQEPFRAGQKGSSAMPHKRNPIVSERITGLARILRGFASAAVENVALWHERDISHSGAERVMLPDATILIDYMQHLALRVMRDLQVHPERMRENLELTHGALFSQRVLLALVEAGMARHDAYRIVQVAAQRAWDERTPLRELLAQDDSLPPLDLEAIFDLAFYERHVDEVLERLEAIP